MKTIDVTDEMYEFLMNLSKELNTQDHRCTAMPYFFQIQTKKEVLSVEGCGVEAWVLDDLTIETDEEIMLTIFEHKNWDIESNVDNDKYNKFDSWDIEELLEEIGYRKINYELTDEYQNAFLTEKACRKHIEANHYHYSDPKDYLQHAFRNPELEKVLEFLCSLSGGSLHR